LYRKRTLRHNDAKTLAEKADNYHHFSKSTVPTPLSLFENITFP